MSTQDSLFSINLNESKPIAERFRPQTLLDYLGQKHLIGDKSVILAAIKNKQPFSMLLWGPPGCGKTTLALILAKEFNAQSICLSAVFSGLKEVRDAINKAQENRRLGEKTMLFIDEIHRFNKAQQDAFLPFVEDGTIIFIGATTENPGFSINSALLSRLRTFKLEALSKEDIFAALQNATDKLGKNSLREHEALKIIAEQADGDCRKALNFLEEWILLCANGINEQDALDQALKDQPKLLDKNGDYFYEMLSAFHKSLRGSNADGAMYWFARMIDGGVDPLIICRRMLCVASEDISNADPQALTMAINTIQAFERLGAPEGYLAIAQCICYLALAAKSNASYKAMHKAFDFVRNNPSYPVPLHLRNAPTKFHKTQNYGQNYRYAHDEEFAYAAGQKYLPDEMENVSFYQPNKRGFESKMAEKLEKLKDLDKYFFIKMNEVNN